MANSFELAQKYLPLLDEVYKEASLTADLDGSPELVREGANANELVIPMLSMDGLADYSRNGGYVAGDVDLTWQTKKCNYDRGRKFTVDALDDEESANIAFGRLAGEFVRVKVAPEVDAFRFASYAGAAGIGTASGALASGANVLTALRAATTSMDEAEVPMDQRYLYITPTLKGMIEDLDTTKSKEVMARFSKIVAVPQTRFYSKITLKDGKTEGQEAGGYAVAEGGKALNFLIIHKPAVIQFPKHVVPRIFTPAQNQSADAWQYDYRNVGIAEVYKNKVAGIYAHVTA
jgi:hypothetical protein